MQQTPPEFESCYRAVAARDARFDGMFYTAVKTTGIYCRPVCPARTPSRSSCSFFATATAAERAGFRPCLRCRPELAPGRSDFGATLAQSIYQRIAEGALDQNSLDRLASQIGVSSRHLRRLLVETFGVTPLEVAQTQRLLFAKKLLHETRLPMTEVALASGFNSVRRFNAAFQENYRMAPSALRRLAEPMDDSEQSITLRLDYRPPFDAARWFSYLGERAIKGIEHADAKGYARTLRIDHGEQTLEGWFKVSMIEQRHGLEVTLPRSLTPALLPLTKRIRRLFDLDADPNRIAEHLALSNEFRSLRRDQRSLRVLGSFEPFELAVRTILGQQVSVRGASTLAARVAERFCEPMLQAMQPLQLLPLRDIDLLKGSQADLCGLGLTRQRAQTLLNLAQFAAAGGLEFAYGATLTDVVERLTSVSGIGEWTAQYVAMRGFGQADAFPFGDLGLRRSIAHFDGDQEQLPSLPAMKQRSLAWQPWRAYAASALWALYKTEAI
jgi:AraC family transcriptional regulator of adaptative response / DNA-3-methyladenine glycosylase II